MGKCQRPSSVVKLPIHHLFVVELVQVGIVPWHVCHLPRWHHGSRPRLWPCHWYWPCNDSQDIEGKWASRVQKNLRSNFTCCLFFHDVKGQLTRPDTIRRAPCPVTLLSQLVSSYRTGAKYDRILDQTPDIAFSFALLALFLNIGPFTINQFQVTQSGRRIVCLCSSCNSNPWTLGSRWFRFA